jgi:hypothetical protein
MSKFEKIKTNLSEILAESTAFGIPRIFKSKRSFFKIFWLAFFLIGSVASIYFTVKSINNYLEYEVIPKMEIIILNQIQFPAITFCSSGFVNKTFEEICDTCSFDRSNDCRMKSEEYFSKFYSYQFDQYCLQFNSGKNMSNQSIPFLNSTIGGESTYGLIISFKSNLSIYIYIDDLAYTPSFINGTRYKTAEFTYQSESISYDLILSITKQIKLGLPYNPCYKDGASNELISLNKTIIEFFQAIDHISYNQKYCYQVCADLEYINTNPCNCQNTSLGNLKRDCWFNLPKVDARYNCTKNYLESFKKQRFEKCSKYCPLECDSIYFKITYKSYYDTKKQIRIYFEDLQYTQIGEIPKTEPFSFVSEIGGILGFFIGCGFVSFFELAELFIEICFILFNKIQKYEAKISRNKTNTEESTTFKKLNEIIESNNEIIFSRLNENENKLNENIKHILKCQQKSEI